MQAVPYFSDLITYVRCCGMMSKSGGVSTWQVDQGFCFELHVEATYVVFVAGDVVLVLCLTCKLSLIFLTCLLMSSGVG